MNRLTREEWEHLIPPNVGDQIHTYHCKEGKGNDKFYIKRLSHGSIAYCHHCHKRGFIPSTKLPAKFLTEDLQKYGSSSDEYGSDSRMALVSHDSRNIREDGRGEILGDSREVRFYLPRDSSCDIRRWSNNDAKIWLIRNGIVAEDLDKYHIMWSEKEQALIFPQLSEEGLVGYQIRKFPQSYPKYRTMTKKGFTRKNNYLRELAIPETRVLFLVEDYISAVRIHKLGRAAYSMSGTSMSDVQFEYLLTQYDTFGIMLDNDNMEVKRSQLKLKNRLEAHGKCAFLYSLDKDPKEYSNSELESYLKMVDT
jgi:hypothetical protein